MPDKKKKFFSEIPPQDFFKQTDLYRNPEINQRMEELGGFYKKQSAKPEVWDRSKQGENGLPYVPRPSMFQPDPFVVGRPEEAQLAKRMIDLDPATKEKIKSVTIGPTKYSMDWATKKGKSSENYSDAGILGITGKDGTIGVEPLGGIGDIIPSYDTTGILAHEIAHQAGYNQDVGLDGHEDATNIGREMEGFFRQRPREEFQTTTTLKKNSRSGK